MKIGKRLTQFDGFMGIWEYGFMKTTLEIPDDLFREAKAKAALEGRKLKDLVADALRQALGSATVKSVPSAGDPADKTTATTRPLTKLRGKGKVLLTNEMIAELEDESLARQAFGGHYQLRDAPIKVSEGNEIRPLTNQEMAELLEREEALRPQ